MTKKYLDVQYICTKIDMSNCGKVQLLLCGAYIIIVFDETVLEPYERGDMIHYYSGGLLILLILY